MMNDGWVSPLVRIKLFFYTFPYIRFGENLVLSKLSVAVHKATVTIFKSTKNHCRTLYFLMTTRIFLDARSLNSNLRTPKYDENVCNLN